MSISLQGCRLILQIMIVPTSIADESATGRQPTRWTYGPLPEVFCAPAHNGGPGVWTHYAITFSRNEPSPLIRLLIDGQDLGSAEYPIEELLPTRIFFNPYTMVAKPRITFGACYNPETRLAKEFLNGELSGVMLLMTRTEPANNLRCISQCGESLLLPDAMKVNNTAVL
ncbi:unnamed protein product [Protopolystoma xenopodis]|uniref:Laminin G domain-containing protein n=1 Tax=Protopolystoma xenopodis TaxID=117903 RepID=A0A3S5AED4_9PLAT|nr:unnamed protein product [Protopolystoma xenopodis]